jgi:hypothetical protein
MKTNQLNPLLFALLFTAATAHADISTRLSDTVNSGTGTINLLKDISGADLARQITSTGKLLFGMDINENASGNETASSIGVALQSVELTVTTTTGTYHFSNFATNSTAVLSKAGTSGLNTYSTLFGQTGSSQLTSTSKDFDLSVFDDVLVLNNVSFTGDVISASMQVQLLNTGNSKAANDTFFDFSGGYEDMALLSAADAYALESAGIGVADAPGDVTYSPTAPVITSAEVTAAGTSSTSSTTTTTTSTTTTTTTSSGPSAPTAAPAAPAPAFWAVIALCVLAFARQGIQRIKGRALAESKAHA